jgi:hypothetical protein
MARKRKPLVINDETVALDAPGVRLLERPNGEHHQYWIAGGKPRAVWNMFARHGGVAEAHESGTDLVDIGKHAQHTDLNTTNRHYIVPSVETSRRVARARVAHRLKNGA